MSVPELFFRFQSTHGLTRRLALALCLWLLFVAAIFQPVLLAGARPQPDTAPALALTPTPFLPVAQTATLPVRETVVSPGRLDGLRFGTVDFANQQAEISLAISPPGADLIEIRFLPGERCIFGDHRACVQAIELPGDKQAIFLTIHSGVGGEGQAFRHALEGTGIDRAGYSLEQIGRSLAGLAGSGTRLTQENQIEETYRLQAVARIPSGRLAEYFSLPPAQGFLLAANDNEQFRAVLENEPGPFLIFETCGWRHPEEPWSEGVQVTTGSVYLGLISP